MTLSNDEIADEVPGLFDDQQGYSDAWLRLADSGTLSQVSESIPHGLWLEQWLALPGIPDIARCDIH